MTDREQASKIYAKYDRAYDGETQGCCMLIAEEINVAIGGEIVAGYIEYCHGMARRTHWWVEKDGQRFDPMGDAKFDDRDAPVWVECHRDMGIFLSILPEYERWRVR